MPSQLRLGITTGPGILQTKAVTVRIEGRDRVCVRRLVYTLVICILKLRNVDCSLRALGVVTDVEFTSSMRAFDVNNCIGILAARHELRRLQG